MESFCKPNLRAKAKLTLFKPFLQAEMELIPLPLASLIFLLSNLNDARNSSSGFSREEEPRRLHSAKPTSSVRSKTAKGSLLKALI